MSGGPTQRIEARTVMPYHLHSSAYFAVVLEGGYVEASEDGRVRVEAGNVLYHPAYQSHFDRVSGAGAVVLNLPAGSFQGVRGWVGAVPDVGRVLRLASQSPHDAVLELAQASAQCARLRDDWPDLLAEELLRSERFRLRDWAREAGLSSEAISRGFRRTFGTTPSKFRLDARAREAMNAVVSSERSLSAIAADHGFSDQSHMTRALRRLTAHTPGEWRRRKSCG